jgi:NAD(P)-dependent dehydrogenase (short-subunit alcohol dehydrogenase family)
MGRLSGRIALITGAARGLGAAMARRFADEGAHVIVNDLSLEAARTTAAVVGGQALAADVSDSSAVAAMFAEVTRDVGRLDILVNNAGISGFEDRADVGDVVNGMLERAAAAARGERQAAPLTTTELSDAEWNKMMGVHVNGTFFCSREALKTMAPCQSGCIINISSIMGTFGRGGWTPYCTAKAAILGFTRALAHEVADYKIRVNAIAPGWIRTDMTVALEPVYPLLEAQTPMARIGEPDDIAWAAVYLASDEAKFMTGQVISPNGGWYMSQ